MTAESRLIRAGAGNATKGFAGLRHKVRSDQLGGAVAILEGTIEPGQFIPPHTHTREDEVSCVIRGELTFRVGDEILKAPAGSYVIKPRGIAHSFWNATDEPAVAIEVHSPGAFEDYYDAFGQLPEGPERMQASIALQRKFGLSMDFELAAQIARENGLHAPFAPTGQAP
jgi:quercetin dioxygenase-like cupin family protein